MADVRQGLLTKLVDAAGAEAAAQAEADPLPRISLDGCERCSSLQRLRQHRGLATLLRVFADAGLAPDLSFNPASQDICVIVPIPSPQQTVKLETEAQVVVWTMVGVSPTQRDDEFAFAALKAKRHGAPWRPEFGLSPPLLANECLQFFAHHTSIAIATRSVDFTQQTIRLKVATVRSVRGGGHRFMPGYLDLNGHDPHTGVFSQATLEEQQRRLTAAMLEGFWKVMNERRYITGPELREKLVPLLEGFIRVSLPSDQSPSFSPPPSAPECRDLALYLHGAAGIGKSEFVRTFSASLEEIVQQFVQPEKRVRVVKVPLNSMTVRNLASISSVKGISDYSIERLCEQALVKKDIVVLHLEENPEEEDQQRAMFDVTSTIIKSLTNRYPESAANVLRIFTSNYVATAAIAERVVSVHMQPPTREQKREWCLWMLGDVASSSGFHIEVTTASDEVGPPRSVEDMRMLAQWHMTVGFQISTALADFATQRGHDPNAEEFVQRARVRLDSPDHNASLLLDIVVQTEEEEVVLPTVRLRCHESVFCCEEGLVEQEKGEWSQVPDDDAHKLNTLLYLFGHDLLRPAVIVLTGNVATAQAYEAEVVASLRRRLGDKLRETHITVLTDEDKAGLTGGSQIQGGLYQFIDHVNNPNATGGKLLFGVVCARVNEVGQFALRELLEAQISRTHLLTVLKDRLMFILTIVDGDIQEQCRSRASQVFVCQ